MNIQLDDELQVLILLNSLPDSWKTLVESMNTLAPNGKVTLTMIKDNLLNEETRRKKQAVATTTDQSNALGCRVAGKRKNKKSLKARKL